MARGLKQFLMEELGLYQQERKTPGSRLVAGGFFYAQKQIFILFDIVVDNIRYT